jgi:hypothetical protein
MKKLITSALLSIGFLLFSLNASATTLYASGSMATFLSNNTISAGDTIVIPADSTLTLSGGNSTFFIIAPNVVLNIYGTLAFTQGSVELHLSGANSRINIYPTGEITSTANSNKIFLCTNTTPTYQGSTRFGGAASGVYVATCANPTFTLLLPPPINPLPLKIISFDAAAKTSVVALKWTAVNDGPANAFTVQQSTDGKSWSNIASVKATGGDHETVSYSYDALAPKAASAIYRVRYMGNNESDVVYSAARLVNLGGISNQTSAIVGAESGRIQIGLNIVDARNATTVMISTVDGKVIYNQQYGTDVNSISIPVTAAGVLFVTITDGASFRIVRKVAIQ